jgi:hypothetical protein
MHRGSRQLARMPGAGDRRGTCSHALKHLQLRADGAGEMLVWLPVLATVLAAQVAVALPLSADTVALELPARVQTALPETRSSGTELALPAPEAHLLGSESLEGYRTSSLNMLRLSLYGLAPAPPAGPGWIAFSVEGRSADPLRIWSRTTPVPGAAAYAVTAPSLLGVTPEILLEAGGLHSRAALDALELSVHAPPALVPEPTPAVLVLLGLGLLRRVASVR